MKTSVLFCAVCVFVFFACQALIHASAGPGERDAAMPALLPGWNHDFMRCSARHPPRLRLPGLLPATSMAPQQMSVNSRAATATAVGGPRNMQLAGWNDQRAKGDPPSLQQPRPPTTSTTDFESSWTSRAGAVSARGSTRAAASRLPTRQRGRMQPLSARAPTPFERVHTDATLPPQPLPPSAPAAAPADAALERPPPPPTPAVAASSFSSASAAAAAAAAKPSSALHIDLHASAIDAGYLQLAAERRPTERPAPNRGAGGAPKLSEADLLAAKEKELDKWLRKFIKREGLQAQYDAVPDEAFERILLREDIGLNAASVQTVVRKELDTHRTRAKHEVTVRRGMRGVGTKAEAVAGYNGRSATRRSHFEGVLEKQCEAVGASLAASLMDEYQASKLEGLREFQVAEIFEKRHDLSARFGEEVEVDLAAALLSPQAAGHGGGAGGDAGGGGGPFSGASSAAGDDEEEDEEAATQRVRGAIDTMDAVATRFAASGGVGASPLQSKLRKAALRSAGAAGALASAGEVEVTVGNGRPTTAGDLPALAEDEEEEEEEEGSEGGGGGGRAAASARVAMATAAVPLAPRAARPAPISALALHSGMAHLPRTPEGAPPIPGLWPRPHSRAAVAGTAAGGAWEVKPPSPGLARSRRIWTEPSACGAASSCGAGSPLPFWPLHAPSATPPAAATAAALDATIGGVRSPRGKAAAAAAAAAGFQLPPPIGQLPPPPAAAPPSLSPTRAASGGPASPELFAARATTPYRCSLSRMGSAPGTPATPGGGNWGGSRLAGSISPAFPPPTSTFRMDHGTPPLSPNLQHRM